MWTIGVADRLRSPIPEPNSESGKCSPSPTTSATADQRFNIYEVNGSLMHPAVAPTLIGADIEPEGLHANNRLSCLTIGGPSD